MKSRQIDRQTLLKAGRHDSQADMQAISMGYLGNGDQQRLRTKKLGGGQNFEKEYYRSFQESGLTSCYGPKCLIVVFRNQG